MVQSHIREKLGYFNKEKAILLEAGQKVVLKEKNKTGKADVVCSCGTESLAILSPEKNVLPYLDGSIQGATKCADAFVYTLDEDVWDLHILELKKTINIETFNESKMQFQMGVYNARAVAGFLGIELRNIYLYSGYRKDAIHNLSEATLIAIRQANNFEAWRLIQEWKKDVCELKIDQLTKKYPLRKLSLDENGSGNLELMCC